MWRASDIGGKWERMKEKGGACERVRGGKRKKEEELVRERERGKWSLEPCLLRMTSSHTV